MSSTKPTIVLVHGAIADGSSWSGVIERLQAKGYNVYAVQQPLSSLPDDIAKVNDALDWIPGPVVLVGHSFGGIVITNAGNHAKVKALVYVAAFAPDENQSAADLGKDYAPLASGKAFQFDKQGRFYLTEPDFLKYFAPDVEPKKARAMAAAQGAADGARFVWKSGPAAWKNKPSYFVVSENDQIIQHELEAFEAKKIKAVKTVSIPNASHAVLVSHPDPVTSLIVEAAEAVAKGH
ncbi:hypothetical protein DFQ27_009416 [Actinomortierella ambigua]|uniref:AB hydrolase-1 domain-containing protein n=1 Tax=Actinomortierella ambigua TaxID=1343610 RepID=A0A9P6TXH6_9FUNG|nr:hypothetical protein DFQ26_002869 [Actinomortierella ambigua]KAG0250409.1 hypothetical protein DFQ27_009416 [Actinomortierella ambigua]